MIIKKFIGKTEEEAAEAAKKELGGGVVIMNVRTVKKKGISGLLGARQAEVTVALEEDGDSLKGVRREPMPAAAQLKGEVQATQTAAKAVSESSQNIEKKLDSLQTLLVSRLKQEEGKSEQPAPEEEPDGREDGSENEAAGEPMGEQEKFIRLLYNTMLENEVDEKNANQIIEDVEKNKKANMPFDYILANVYQKMVLKFGRAEGVQPAEKGPRTLFFIGPTGVGKTTTIAKIASYYCVEQKKKVALLTADTYRIAAAEQLRTYANILEVPFRVIYSEEEVKGAIEDFKDYDYIFIDTAGHSHRNDELLEKAGQLLNAARQVSECQAFLVISATTKYKDLMKIATNYREITDYQLIFTKLDETAALGNLMNLRMFTGVPIAYVTCGQNVPDDIEQFNPQKTVKHLLKKNQEG